MEHKKIASVRLFESPIDSCVGVWRTRTSVEERRFVGFERFKVDDSTSAAYGSRKLVMA